MTVPGAPPASASALRAVAIGIALPALAGAACVAGFAPFYFWPAPIAALAALFAAWRLSGSPLQAALSGFAFGLGLFLGGVSWVYVSLHEFGAMPAALAAAATFLFCAYLALFPAAAGWAVVRLGGASGARRLALAPAATCLLEWLRGTLFTGFPWLNLGTSQVPGSPLAGFAPLAGAYGATLAVAAAAALAVAVAGGAAPRRRLVLAASLAALFAAGAGLRAVEWTRPAGAPVRIALLQGNVPQQLKWRDEVRGRIIDAYRDMIVAAPAPLVVIPETALPAFLDELPPGYLESLREHARASGKEILIGSVERERRGAVTEYFNSVVRIGGDAAMPSYRKRHLVPFGEFIPPGFRWILAVLHIPMSDFAAGARDQPALHAGGIAFGVAICYEDIFGEEVIDALPAAQVLLNVSNDAWFGESFAADQHLQASQMRALETGRWMVRSTNTGATAAIDHRGVVVARLPAFTSGTLVEPVVPRAGMTPYARFGNAPALLLAAALAAAALRAGRRGGTR